jgi:dihydroflavonol-4-reductase
MRVLATGANGHLGANVVRSLLRRGYQVVPFVRRGADLRGLDQVGLDYAYGDVMDEHSLCTAAEGCDVMLHMAATYRYWMRDPANISLPALVGTRNAFAAAKAAGMRRMVYTSSNLAVGLSERPDKVLTHKDWNQNARNPYTIAKIESEREAWRLADKMGIEMIAICPTGLIGPYDYRVTPSSDTVRSLINGTAPLYEGAINFVHVGEAAEVHAGAVEGGKPGERYITAGDNAPLSHYGEVIASLTGEKPFTLPGGRRALQFLASVSELASSITRSEPLLTRDLADEVGGRYMYYDCSNTTRDFGITFSGSEKVVSEGIRWLLKIGQIKPKLAVKLAERLPPDPSWTM